jgi:hypothetical protein
MQCIYANDRLTVQNNENELQILINELNITHYNFKHIKKTKVILQVKFLSEQWLSLKSSAWRKCSHVSKHWSQYQSILSLGNIPFGRSVESPNWIPYILRRIPLIFIKWWTANYICNVFTVLQDSPLHEQVCLSVSVVTNWNHLSTCFITKSVATHPSFCTSMHPSIHLSGLPFMHHATIQLCTCILYSWRKVWLTELYNTSHYSSPIKCFLLMTISRLMKKEEYFFMNLNYKWLIN